MSRRIVSRAAVVMVLAALSGIAQSLSPASSLAQGDCRTFTETGKTVCSRFLQYWQQNGGLSQQGFPISDVIQETNDTDGKIYSVQYFERAIFEFHPENKPPSDVLLSLLGVFLYGQKYPQGAPGATPNNEAGSRLFSETGHRLGGTFYDYWRTHGGLAQQGFPISDEFMETSDLDGKTYKVQYFQRAVFEYHPENNPPFNVLLSQLGTFRYRAKYATNLAQVSGTGNNVSTAFNLKKGLAVFQSVRAYDGYFYINVLDANNQQVATVGSVTGPGDVSVPVRIEADGAYKMEVQSEGGWTVNVTQPTAAYAPPPAMQQWKGHGWQATPFFSLKAGKAHFHAVSPNDKAVSTDSISRVDLLTPDATEIGSFAESKDPVDATVDIDIPADGVYMLRVFFMDADWTITVEQ